MTGSPVVDRRLVRTGVAADAGTRGEYSGRRRPILLGWLRGTPLAVFWLLLVGILVLPILLFLLVAFSPRLFDQGDQWVTLDAFVAALHGPLLEGLRNSLLIGVAAALAAAVIGFGFSWAVQRTTVRGRPVWTAAMFALLLTPSYLVALGWERLLEPAGVLELLGLDVGGVRSVFYGPVGVVVVLTVKGVPFAYLTISAALRGLGAQFEAAVRVHGGSRRAAVGVVVSLLAPAIWSALAIVFAESISDFGVAATLGADAHFPVATFTLYQAVGSFPINFPIAAAVGWLLLAMAGLALLAQARALRGRSYRVLSGRSRPARRHRLSVAGHIVGVAVLALIVVLGLGVPVFGAVSASLVDGLGSLAGTHAWTVSNYQRVLGSDALREPLLYSARLAAVTATAAVAIGLVVARLLTRGAGRASSRLLDLLLLTAVALPGIVFAAGYIFTYNLPLTNAVGIHLYGTTALLVLGYLATALPATSRVLLGSIGQVQESLREAGRVHGSGPVGSWVRTVLPVLARPVLAAWMLTFAATLLELPMSQLLYPPDHPPVTVGITKALANYDFGGGTAMEVSAVVLSLVVVAVLWGGYHLIAPAGWRQFGRTR